MIFAAVASRFLFLIFVCQHFEETLLSSLQQISCTQSSGGHTCYATPPSTLTHQHSVGVIKSGSACFPIPFDDCSKVDLAKNNKELIASGRPRLEELRRSAITDFFTKRYPVKRLTGQFCEDPSRTVCTPSPHREFLPCFLFQ